MCFNIKIGDIVRLTENAMNVAEINYPYTSSSIHIQKLNGKNIPCLVLETFGERCKLLMGEEIVNCSYRFILTN